MRLVVRLLVILLASSSLLGGAGAADGLIQEDRAEQRLKTIASGLRCPVCQGEAVYDSHSTIANQMKTLIREQVAAGRTDDEIRGFFVTRYGAFVLMEPAASGMNLMIWLFPLLALSAGMLAILVLLGRRRQAVAPPATSVGGTEEFLTRLERLEP
ncbi:MAG: cytochrome c-type biogenesis protein CcmH [Alphaproteobacteria bacterium]|nr:cytochrome c-type biogenesis protein CcmH [Alphaproteobacteria bacterium]